MKELSTAQNFEPTNNQEEAGLDDQSFFYAPQEPPQHLPQEWTDFIIKRMTERQ